MNRRNFIKALSAFVAVASVAPQTLASQPVDWTKWNEFELRCERDTIKQLLVNGRDFTQSREARERLAQMLHFEGGKIFIGDRRDGQLHGVQWHVAEYLPDDFTMGLRVRFNGDAPTSYAMDGQVVRHGH